MRSMKSSTARQACGEPSLNEWLRSRALKNESVGASRTFVSIDKGSDPVPILLIGRLAVDITFTGVGLGASLLQIAVLKGIEASRIVGARSFVVDALNDDAARFYRAFGFEPMPPAAKRPMFLLLKDAEATIAALAR